jgi:hypothetical protein
VKHIQVNLWGFVFGQDVLVKQIEGTFEEVLGTLQELSPLKDTGAIRLAMNQSVWADGVQWIGGHQVGIEVLSVLLNKITPLHNRAELSDASGVN